jgi:hypothetical protein
LAGNQNGKREVVVLIRERDGNSIPAVFNSESQAASFIRARIAEGTVVYADDTASWDNLHERFEVKTINHQEAYSIDGACTGMAEEYFSRLGRAEIGIHHHIAGSYPLHYGIKVNGASNSDSWRRCAINLSALGLRCPALSITSSARAKVHRIGGRLK